MKGRYRDDICQRIDFVYTNNSLLHYIGYSIYEKESKRVSTLVISSIKRTKFQIDSMK